jgi:hypothetical protein
MLIGHHKKEEGLAAKVGAIFVGQFITLGDGPGADEPGMEYFDNAQVKVEQSLKGTLSGIVKVSYSVMSIPTEKESSPKSLKDYIFFINIISPTQLSVVKLLPATDQNVAKIKALIAAVPAAK